MSEFFNFIPEYSTEIHKFAPHEPADAISVLNPRFQQICNNIAYVLQLLQTSNDESSKNIEGLETEITRRFNQLQNDTTQLLQEHTNSRNNPHAVTKSQVGLGNVDNTSDANKPISTATQAASNGKSDTSHTHAATDITLDSAHRFVTDSEKSTWNGKANSSHTHVASHITQDSSHRFVTDSEKSAWNGKANASHTHTASSVGALPITGGTLTGDLRIKGAGNYGTKINLGDGDYVHFYEPTDDNLEIKAKNVNFVVSGTITKNGAALTDWSGITGKPSSFTPASHTHNYSSITSGIGSDYSTYRVRDIALLSYTPSSLGNGQIALVYT